MPVGIAGMGWAQLPGSEGKALFHKDIGRQTRTTTMHREQNDERTLGILHDSVAPAWDLGSPDLTANILPSSKEPGESRATGQSRKWVSWKTDGTRNPRRKRIPVSA